MNSSGDSQFRRNQLFASEADFPDPNNISLQTGDEAFAIAEYRWSKLSGELGARQWLPFDGPTDFVRYIDPNKPKASDKNAGTDPNKPWKTLKPLFDSAPLVSTGKCQVFFGASHYQWPRNPENPSLPAFFTVGVPGESGGSMAWLALSMDLVATITVAVASLNPYTLKSLLTDAQVEGATIFCKSGANAGQYRTIAQGGDSDGVDPAIRVQLAFDAVPQIGDVYQITRPNVVFELPGTADVGTIRGVGNHSSGLDVVGVKFKISDAPTARFAINDIVFSAKMSEIEGTLGGLLDVSGITLRTKLSASNPDLINPKDQTGLYIHSEDPATGITVLNGTSGGSSNAMLVGKRAGFRLISGDWQFTAFQANDSPILAGDGATWRHFNTGNAGPARIRNADAATTFPNFAEVFNAILISASAYGSLNGLEFDPGTAAFPWDFCTFAGATGDIGTAGFCTNKPGTLSPSWAVQLAFGSTVSYASPNDADNVMGAAGAVLMAIGFSQGFGAAQLSAWTNYQATGGVTPLSWCDVDNANLSPGAVPFTNPANTYELE